MRTTPAIEGPYVARRLLRAMAAVLVLACFAPVRLGQQRTAPPSRSRVLIQNRSSSVKQLPGPNDGGKSVAVPPVSPPNQSPNPNQPPPRQGPPLQLTSVPQLVRVGEEVKFTMRLAAESPTMAQSLPPLVINFDDGTPVESVGLASGISHRFAKGGNYNVSVNLNLPDAISRSGQPRRMSNNVTVQVNPWSLTASKSQVEVGEPVTLKIDNPPSDRRISFRFNLMEDSQTTGWNAEADTTYRYHSATKFSPFAEVRVNNGSNEIVSTTEPREILVQELPRAALVLEVNPQSIQVGQSVSFTATLNSKFETDDQGIVFNFFFGGDATPSGWQRERTVQHVYTSAADYQARVEVGWRRTQSNVPRPITSSVEHLVSVAAIPRDNPTTGSSNTSGNSNRNGSVSGNTGGGGPDRPPYLVYILTGLVIAIAALFAGYKSWKGHFSVRPEYVAQADRGTVQTNDGRLSMDFEVLFTPNVKGANYQIDASDTGLIRFERITHD